MIISLLFCLLLLNEQQPGNCDISFDAFDDLCGERCADTMIRLHQLSEEGLLIVAKEPALTT